MQKRNHLLVSPAGALATAALTHAHTMWYADLQIDALSVAVSLAGGIAGAMLPDIDMRFRGLVEHRTWTHSLLAVGVVSVFSIAAGWWVSSWMYQDLMPLVWLFLFSYIYSYIFHLIADSTTKTGVPLYYPWQKRRFHMVPFWMRISTGRSLHEGPTAVVLSMLFIIISYSLRYGFVSLMAMIAA